MHAGIIESLLEISEEERAILAGQTDIDKALYYRTQQPGDTVVDASRLLRAGRLMDIRRHVRFVHFPEHSHNYVEFIYMCQGATTHIVDGQRLVLREGELLFLNQHARQEILPAGEQDLAVNFLILPEFFDTALQMMGSEENALRSFVIGCLTQKNQGGNFLHFRVSSVLPVQNLMENLIWQMLQSDEPEHTDRDQLQQITMGLLFLTLLKYTDYIQLSQASYEQNLMLQLLSYIELEYRHASLAEFAHARGYDIYTISRLIKRHTHHNFKELLQMKRLNQACYFLRHTDIAVADIAALVGYDNTSFFHRLFRRTYGKSPREYRLE